MNPSRHQLLERGEKRRKKERSLWVKGIDRQLWDPTSRDHTPASHGFHGDVPEMRDFVREREITGEGGWRQAKRTCDLPKGHSSKQENIGDRREETEKETGRPKRIFRIALMSVCLYVLICYGA